MYVDEDPDIALFAKLLKNEFEEDFRYVHFKVKDTILRLFKNNLRKNNPHKTEPQIDQMLFDL